MTSIPGDQAARDQAAGDQAARDHTHAVHNGKRELSIDELARMQPGMDVLMAEVGPRMHRLYFAARAGNWPLASYFFTSVVKQLRLCGQSRPKYAADIDSYLTDHAKPVGAAIKAGNSAAFETAYARLVDEANRWHVVYRKPFIVWRTPAEPPHDLDLTAGMT